VTQNTINTQTSREWIARAICESPGRTCAGPGVA